MKLRISRQAWNDLLDVKAYTLEQYGLDQLEQYESLIERALGGLRAIQPPERNAPSCAPAYGRATSANTVAPPVYTADPSDLARSMSGWAERSVCVAGSGWLSARIRESRRWGGVVTWSEAQK